MRYRTSSMEEGVFHTYWYEKNLQGDVIGVYNEAGARLISYDYDAWGRMNKGVGNAYGVDACVLNNPFTYRGYYYDAETGLYYISSRYYDPAIGRFINADDIDYLGADGSLLSYNLFAYCKNNPVNISVVSNPAGKSAASTKQSAKKEFYIPELKLTAIDLSVCVQYNVPLYNQNGYNLCWAFCQVMVEDFRAGRTRTNAQATERAISISKSVYGDDWNQGGWPTNCRDLFGDTGINSINSLYNALVENGPIYAYYGGSTGAHLVVVTGVNKAKGIVYTNNPWGIAGEQSYSDFLKGFAGMPSDWDMPFRFYIFTK